MIVLALHVCVRGRWNTHGRTQSENCVLFFFKSGNFEEMLYEGRMEDNFLKFFYIFGEHALGIHEDLIWQSVKQKKDNGLGNSEILIVY